ncbi:hypothetical protein DMN91_009049 [Ooceraea biroi]|uniref:Axonemal dynein light intermediate polypeptide n=1 Tax=Ooceraea biroi TaxID=2015173 RepID=A0A3L8DES6_OOCBI|nr:hypothetical protein DMN91_009049 [Ooceraea biroi]
MATAVQDRIIPTMDTLVKYDKPVLVTTHPEKVRKDSALPKIGAAACKVEKTSAPADTRKETIEILNKILPPKEWEEDGQIWTQRVKLEIFFKTNKLIINLKIIIQLYVDSPQTYRYIRCCLGVEYSRDEAGYELIRQVTVNCAERGLLLLRVRDELRMTLLAYQTLYQSSIAFGIRKALQAEQGKENLINTAEELRLEKTELEKTVAELRLKFDQAERRATELREAEEKKHMEEIQFLKKTNLQLKTQLEGIIAPKK